MFSYLGLELTYHVSLVLERLLALGQLGIHLQIEGLDVLQLSSLLNKNRRLI
jgi:hypothetical protein